MTDHEKNEINKDTLEQMSNKADELIQKGDRLKLERYTKQLTESRLFFADLIDEARFLYIMGNCYQGSLST
ncbi:hypothetical protein [Enterobacter hormaechei]|uniref:hypothetical protein n=1 Tax=Enterobacter hormaechei TaxID=158836 RepID=UPI0022F0B214|nr:hypothetical protein [Enterobacter hormaechei]MDA4818470.1 hypothetical protein [Enterobacter hormaechei]